MGEKRHFIAIWFFIGLLLAFYGAVITGVSVYHVFVPPERPAVLAGLYPGVWWGLLLLALGLLYSVRFYPRD